MNIAVIGGGRAAETIIPQLTALEGYEIIGVADLDPEAVGVRLARRMQIPTVTDMRRILPSAELIIDLTGAPGVLEGLNAALRPDQAVLSAQRARSMVDLLGAQRRRAEALSRRLNEELHALNAQVSRSLGPIDDASTQALCALLREAESISVNATIEAASAGDSGGAFGAIIDRVSGLVDDINALLNLTAEAPRG